MAFVYSMVVEIQRTRPGDLHAEHGLRAARLSGDGRVDQLRTGRAERTISRPSSCCRTCGDFRRTDRPTGAAASSRRRIRARWCGPARRTRSSTSSRRRAPILTRRASVRGWPSSTRMNRAHAAQRPGDSRLDARVQSYELAARLQSARRRSSKSAPNQATRRLYGLDEKITEDFGRRCLIARRLLERGVRFVQVWSGGGQRLPAAKLGLARGTGAGSRRDGREHGPPRRGAHQRPEGARAAGRYHRDVDHGVRSHALQSGQ